MKYAAQVREQEGRKEFITDLKGAFLSLLFFTLPVLS
jgi:hypothetical protein